MSVLNKLKDQTPFIKSVEVMDYSKTMGQYALFVYYTNGDHDVFTTPGDPNRSNDKGDFKDKEEMLTCWKYLKDNI